MSVGTNRPSVSRISSRSSRPATIRLNERFTSSSSEIRLEGSARTWSSRSDSTERAADASARSGRLARAPSHAASATETTRTAIPASTDATTRSSSPPSAAPVYSNEPLITRACDLAEPLEGVARSDVHVDPHRPRLRPVAIDVPIQVHVVVVADRHAG